MSISVRIAKGRDAGARAKQAGEPFWGRQQYILGGASGDGKRIFLKFPSLAQQVKGQQVLSATLSGRLKVGGNHTVEIAELTEDFDQQTRWNRQPAVRSAGQVSAPTTAGNGQRWSIDVTTLVQRVAAGVVHRGFRLATPATNDRVYYGFESGNAWRLDVVVAEESDAPVALEPDGGAVGLPKPTLVWTADDGDPDEPADGSGAQVAYQLRISTTETTAGIVYDSGTVSSVENQHDMSAFAYSLPSGTGVFWQVRTRDVANVWTEYSDWAEMVYRPYPSVSITSPTTLIYDPSPPVQVTVSGGALFRYQVLVTQVGAPRTVLYDSGRIKESASPFTHTIPEFYRDARVFQAVDGAQYVITVKVEDRDDRVGTPGDPDGSVTATRTVAYGAGPEPAPTALTVAQVAEAAPTVRLSWTRTPTPDGFIVERDGQVLAKLDLAALSQSGSRFTWDDETAKPGFHAYRVRTMSNSSGAGAFSSAVTLTVGVRGAWIIRDKANVTDGGLRQINFQGESPPQLERDDSVAEYDTLSGKQTLRITYARRHPRGAWVGYLFTGYNGQDLDAALKAVRELEADPEETVTLIWGEESIRAKLDNLFVTSGDGDGGLAWKPDTRLHKVSCVVRKVADA